jgi:hypothetical protein
MIAPMRLRRRVNPKVRVITLRSKAKGAEAQL